MTVINTNISATLASNAISRNDRAMTTAMERLSTGLRINSASDDAAGLAIASRMRSQVEGLEQAARNANDGISMIQTAEGAYIEVSNMLARMKELAVQSNSGTYSATDRAALDLEFSQLRSELHRISENTQWNGFNILDGAAGGSTANVSFQVGAGSGQSMTATFSTLYASKKSTASTTTAAVADTSTQKTDVTIDRTNVVAGDKLTFTVVDSAGNEVDVLINLDSDAVTALEGDGGHDIASNVTDVAYIGGGRGTALDTVLNGVTGGGGITVRIGADKADAEAANKIQIHGTADGIDFTIKNATTGGVRIVRGETSELDAYGVDTASDANASIAKLDTLITNVSASRAKYGSYINRLEYASDNLMNVAQNTDASRSQIEDADYAAETSELARTQIIAQASTAMLAQANQSKQSVLALLQ